MDESSFIGESKLISEKPGDFICSGTNVTEGIGKMIVVDAESNYVSDKIKARVYESGIDDELNGEGEESLVFTKFDTKRRIRHLIE